MPTTTTSVRTFKTAPTSPPPKQKRQFKLPVYPKLGGRVHSGRVKLPWLVAGGFALFGLFMVGQYHAAQAKVNAPARAQAQVNSLLGNVGKLIILPKNEMPTIAIVAHADQLRSQQFFSNARDGDKVLVYAKAKEAILYRPSSNQLVTVAPVTTAADGSASIQ